MASMAKTTVWTVIGEILRFFWSALTMMWRLAMSIVQSVSKIDGNELNKVMAAVLLAGVIAMSSGFIADLLVHSDEVTEFAFAPDMAAGPAEIAVEEEPEIDIATLLQTADAEAGQALIRACTACHTFDQGGADRVGPHMWGVVGREKAGVAGFNYSSAMEAAGGAWTFENLNGFLLRPRDYLPGTSMSYAGMRDAEDRANLIAYLRTLDENPVALPEPPPAEVEPAAAEEAEGAAGVPADDAMVVDPEGAVEPLEDDAVETP